MSARNEVPSKQVTLTIRPELYAAFQAYAQETGANIAEIMRTCAVKGLPARFKPQREPQKEVAA